MPLHLIHQELQPRYITIFNIIDEVMDSAIQINKTYDLSKIVTSASDEVYQNNKPILAVVDSTHRCSSMVENLHSRLRP